MVCGRGAGTGCPTDSKMVDFAAGASVLEHPAVSTGSWGDSPHGTRCKPHAFAVFEACCGNAIRIECCYLPPISCYTGAETASLRLSGPMKHLRIMRYVDEVARTGSIRKAANQLNVTASAVNRRIIGLEEELGTLIFERPPRGGRLTAPGGGFARLPRPQGGDGHRLRAPIEGVIRSR